MKKLYLAALLAVPLLASTARADGCIFPIRVEGRCNWDFRMTFGGCGPGGCAQLGPWYHYWPLDAHFITPAPTGYPYWPQPQSLPPNPVLPPPQPDPKPGAGPDVKPVGYAPYAYPYSYQYAPSIYYGQAPSYWYSRP
jgi:hypothetical protein